MPLTSCALTDEVARSGLCWAGILHPLYLLTTGFVFESTLIDLGYRRTEALWQALVCSLAGLNAFLLSQARSRRQRGPGSLPQHAGTSHKQRLCCCSRAEMSKHILEPVHASSSKEIGTGGGVSVCMCVCARAHPVTPNTKHHRVLPATLSLSYTITD